VGRGRDGIAQADVAAAQPRYTAITRGSVRRPAARLPCVSDDIDSGLSPVTVIRNKEIRAAGRRAGDVIVYDWGFEWRGSQREQRSFVLLDDGVQINQPVIFPPERRGWWYCDLVKVVDHDDLVVVDDLWIDVIVGPPDHPYRLLDLDEYAAAMESGTLSAADAVDGLVRTQRFLDRRLNRRYDHPERIWLDFPPASVEALMRATFPREWSRFDS
jgi:hypothetical protein